MPYALLAATLLALVLHGWYATTTPLVLVLGALLLWMGFGSCRGVWQWLVRPRRFGRG